MTSRLSKRPADRHVTHDAMTTASEHVVARVGKSPSEFHDSPYYYYGDVDYSYGQSRHNYSRIVSMFPRVNCRFHSCVSPSLYMYLLADYSRLKVNRQSYLSLYVTST